MVDINNDGYADIVTYNSSKIEYRLSQNTTVISFGIPKYLNLLELMEVVTLDINGDHFADLVVTTAMDLEMSLWSPALGEFQAFQV